MAKVFNILIVDDEPDIVESISSVLDVALPGSRLFPASDGVEALEILRSERIDLILSDYKMPRMDGIEFMMLAKQEYPLIPRLLITAYPDPALAARAVRDAGVGLFVAKPFDVTYLVEVLKAFAPDE